MRTDWHTTVYRPKSSDDGCDDKFYEMVDAECVKRRYVCQACRKRKGRRILTLHHITPRSAGGETVPSNLILLCCECHDRVEKLIRDFPNASAICYAFARRKALRAGFSESYRELCPDSDIGQRWQEWVYGGKRNPLFERSWPR